ncbi:MAG: MFS transporter, partial [Anaerolineales bacterium]
SIICGLILDGLSFPFGYILVFAIGVLGAAMSSFHLGQIHVDTPVRASMRLVKAQGNLAVPGQVRTIGDAIRSGFGLRFLTRLHKRSYHPILILRGPFAVTLVCLFFFHLTQHMAIPLFPLYWVEQLELTDRTISLGNALFYSFLFLGSTQLGYLTPRWGNYRCAVAGALLLSVYPALTALAQDITMFLIATILGGLFAAISTGVVGNYLLDKVPNRQRPLYISWYIITLNGAVLLGSLLGPILSFHLGLILALFVIAVGRGLSGLILWRWGQ